MKDRYNRYGISQDEWKRRRSLRLPQPQNAAEFAIISEWIIGKPLTVKFCYARQDGCSYEILEKHNKYGDWLFGASYDVESWLCNHCFGGLRCGGIAGSNYGQTKFRSHRQRRALEFWTKNGKGSSSVRPAFIRLAAQVRERRKQNNSRQGSAPIDGRVDGVSGASFCETMTINLEGE